MDFKGKKWAVYLRRSKGESGSTKEQLEQIMQFIEPLEKSKKMRKINRGVVGRDIDKKRKGVDLELKGDIYNEGDGFSGYNVAGRPVFMELLTRLRDGQYDGVLAVSMDRYARNYGALSRYAYDLWAEMAKPRVFYGFAEQRGLGQKGEAGILNEAVLSSLMNWGGIAKKLEIQKAETKRTGTGVDKGYLAGSTPEFLGKTYRGKTTKIVKYRDAANAALAGEGAYNIARAAGKYDKFGQPNSSWTRTWKPRFLNYAELGVLDDWLDAFEAINEYIKGLGGYPANAYKSKEVTRILKHTRGYFGYPAGLALVNPNDGTLEFVEFPNPLEIGLDKLADVDDPTTIPEFVVNRRILDDEELEKLNVVQTQPRAGGKKRV